MQAVERGEKRGRSRKQDRVSTEIREQGGDGDRVTRALKKGVGAEAARKGEDARGANAFDGCGYRQSRWLINIIGGIWVIGLSDGQSSAPVRLFRQCRSFYDGALYTFYAVCDVHAAFAPRTNARKIARTQSLALFEFDSRARESIHCVRFDVFLSARSSTPRATRMSKGIFIPYCFHFPRAPRILTLNTL